MKITTDKQIRKILDGIVIIPLVEPNKAYTRLHDDHDGTYMGKLTVGLGIDGDAYVGVDSNPILELRFRTHEGGGASLRTHNALRILCEAIRLDNLDHPRPIKFENPNISGSNIS